MAGILLSACQDTSASDPDAAPTEAGLDAAADGSGSNADAAPRDAGLDASEDASADAAPVVDGSTRDADDDGAAPDASMGDASDDGAVEGPCSGRASGEVCRAAAGPCDAEEVCDGQSAACPEDGALAEGTACASGGCTEGACDAEGSCVQTLPCPVFVDAAQGSDSEDCGTSWESACATLQVGSDRARDGVPKNSRVFAMGGMPYTAALGESVLTMAEGVAYYGGFSDASQQHPSERSLDAADYSVLDGQSPEPSAGAPVVVAASEARLDGFEVRGGATTNRASGLRGESLSGLTVAHARFVDNHASSAGEDVRGGAMACDECGQLTIDDVTFEMNAATFSLSGGEGGALSLRDTATTLVDSRFIGNRAEQVGQGAGNYGHVIRGGAIASVGGTLDVRDCALSGNEASADYDNTVLGGAAYVEAQSDAWTRVRFVDNRARCDSNYYQTSGGALYEAASESTLADVWFEGNRAEGPSGGSPVRGGGQAAEGYVNVTLSQVGFVHNWLSGGSSSGAMQGGGLYAVAADADAQLTIERSSFVQNYDGPQQLAWKGVRPAPVDAPTTGGGAFLRGGKALLEGVRFQSNVSGSASGEVGRGGGLTALDAALEVRDTDFVGNVAYENSDGWQARAGALYFESDADLSLTNVAFVDNVSHFDYAPGAATPMTFVGSGERSLAFVTSLNNRGYAAGVEPLLEYPEADDVRLLAVARDAAPDYAEHPTQCAITEADVERSADGHVYLLPAAAARCNSVTDAEANAAFAPIDWTTLTTRFDGTLDSSPADPGRHYAPGALRITTFEAVDATTVRWEVVTTPDTHCSLRDDDGMRLVDAADLPAAQSTVNRSATGATLQCASRGSVVRASLSMP